MKIDLHNIKVSELVEGYIDNHEEGVRGYGGRLNIRPPYQREFIYKDKQRNAVIDTVRKGLPAERCIPVPPPCPPPHHFVTRRGRAGPALPITTST